MARLAKRENYVPSVKKSIRYPADLIADYVKISKVSKIPKDALVVSAMRKYLSTLKKQYPDYIYIKLRDAGKDERI